MDTKKDTKENRNIDRNLNRFESKNVFHENGLYRYVFKKNEKIVAALYLITNLISDQEPLKWRIRDTALNSLSQTLLLSQITVEDQSHLVTRCATAFTEVISLCQIAHVSKHISEMNYSVLMREFSQVLEVIESLGQERTIEKTPVLSTDFFAMPEVTSAPTVVTIKKTQTDTKGHNAFSTVSNTPTNKMSDTSAVVVRNDFSKGQSVVDEKKQGRRERILMLLKKQNNLGIKDFSREITDCSEKTIQRELLLMAEEGVLNKKGERRWSVYSLVS